MKIDLGQKYDEMMPSAMIDKRETHYPSFRFTTDEMHDIPRDGEMTIRFHKNEFSMREGPGKKTVYECTVEVREITDISGSKESDEDSEPSHKQTERAMGKLRKAKMSSHKNNDEDEGEEY